MENEQGTGFDWSKYSGQGAEGRYHKPELGKTYKIRFKSVSEGTIPEKDKSGVLTGKTIPSVHLEIAVLDGVVQEPALAWDTTSKTLLRQLAVYHKDGVLFDYDFNIAKVQLGGKQYPEFQVTPVLAKGGKA